VPELNESERELQTLAAELRRLESEYNMYFAGRLPRPPFEVRARVEAMLKRLDRNPPDQLAQRFRLQTLNARFSTFAELWDRGMRAREEGRAGPFARGGASRPAAGQAASNERLLHVASFEEPSKEPGRLQELYDALAEARRNSGEAPVPFHKFAHLVRDQIAQLRTKGAGEVAFRVSVREGRVRLTARGMKAVEG
jgi:hypothetical protein